MRNNGGTYRALFITVLETHCLHQHICRVEKTLDKIVKEQTEMRSMFMDLISTLKERNIVESLEEVRAETVQMADMKESLGLPFQMDYEKVKKVRTTHNIMKFLH